MDNVNEARAVIEQTHAGQRDEDRGTDSNANDLGHVL